MSNAKDFYSDSVTGAIRQACGDFAVSQEKLDIEVLETGSKGIFGLCKKRAHIRVNLKENASLDSQISGTGPQKEVRESASGPEGEFIVECACDEEDKETVGEKKIDPPARKAPSSEGAVVEEKRFEMPSEEVLKSIQDDLVEVVRLMGFESEVTVQVVDKEIHCHLSGAYEESLVGPDGRTLDSLQYLIRKMVSRRVPNRMIVDLDAGNFRARRMKELQQLAAEMAEQVKEDGKTKAIPALNPSERRVVHVTLQDDKGIRSRSVGDGIFKKVLIYKPGKGRKSGGRRRGRPSGGASKQ